MSIIRKACKSNPAVIVIYEDDDTDGANGRGLIPWPEDVCEFIGLALHSIQQWQASELHIHGHPVEALLIDQTGGGAVDPADIFRVNDANKPFQFQRLKHILLNDFQV